MRKTTIMPRENYANEQSLLCQFRFLRVFSLALAFMAMSAFQASAQCTLAFTDINISVNMDCEALITPGMFADTSGCVGGDFVVNVYHNGVLIPTSPLITSEYIDERVTLELVDLVSGNTGWSYGYVEDKFPPVLSCTDTIRGECGILPNYPDPDAFENCGGPVTVILLDERVTLLNCDTTYISRVVRKYTAEDERGNRSDTCEQVFLLKRIDGDAIDFPDTLSVATNNPLICTGEWDLNGNGIPEPLEINSVPTVAGGSIYPYSQFCNTTVTYNDVELAPLHCNRLIMRVWAVSEWWCNQQVIYSGIQLIEIADTVAPVFTCPSDFTVSAGIHDCSAQVNLPAISATDDCQDVSDIEVDIIYPGGFLNNQNGGIVELTGGVHTIEYRAFDQCGNMENCFVTVTVVDDNPPVPVCDAYTVVSLTLDGTGKAFSPTFDDGSFDNCGSVYFKVRRMTIDACDGINGDDNEAQTGYQEYFDDYVKFCCEDVDNGPVLVRFRVYDVDPGEGPVAEYRHSSGGDLVGRYNECMVEVEVQDKLAPTITCPPDITISCTYDFDPLDLEQFGTVVIGPDGRNDVIIYDPNIDEDPVNYGKEGFTSDNCIVDVDERIIKEINTCNIGEIRRFFVAEDAGDRTSQCLQRITIIRSDTFNADHIIWPENYEAEDLGCNAGTLPPESLPDPFSEPSFTETECDQVAVSYKDEVFVFNGAEEACFKIIRTWKVIDWCGEYDNGNGGTSFPQYTHQQVIKVFNTIAPVITSDCGPLQICTFDDECADGFIELNLTAADDCTLRDDLNYSYKIDLNQDNIYEIEASGSNATGSYPIGRHNILWTVEDGCGNKTSCTQEFNIANCKKPTPKCKGFITVVDETTGTVEVWANDFDDGSYHICPSIKVFASFSPDSVVLNRTFDCDDLGINMVEIWIIDENGNSDFCIAELEVQDDNNGNGCDGFRDDGDILGLISTEDGDEVADVTVTLEGGIAPDAVTGDNGLFAFPDMPFGGSYTVIPSNNDNPLNGISTYDILLIQKYIQGVRPLNSAYKVIAADVNNTEEVTALDIIELRRLLLGYYSEFQNNTSWRFIDADHNFTDDSNPWNIDFPEEYVIDPFEEHMMDVDFRAVKIGDVNGSASTNGLIETEDRTGGAMTVSLLDQKINRGDLIRVPVQVNEAEKFQAYQYGWTFDASALNYEGYSRGALQLDESFFGTLAVESGQLSTMWFATAAQKQMTTMDVLYTLEFTAMADGYLSDYLNITEDYIASEAVTRAEEQTEVNLEYRSSTTADAGVVFYQNRPNPFSNETDISFSLPEASEATITILDISGKIILAKTGYFDKGLNVVKLQASELNSDGVLIYRLETEDFVQMKKMILVK